MNCNICGKNRPLVRAVIENVGLDVCSECSDYGEVIKENKFVRVGRKPRIEVVELIVSDYSERIKRKREGLKMTQKQLAYSINEKESVIHSIESSRLEPDVALARRLEKFLGIKLVVVHEEDYSNKVNLKDKSLTIGDLINFRDE